MEACHPNGHDEAIIQIACHFSLSSRTSLEDREYVDFTNWYLKNGVI